MSIIRIEYTTTPATPPADKLKIYADTADNRLKTINESGIIRILDADEAYQFVTFANDAAYEAVYTAETGSVYYNTTSSVIRIYDGATWSDISGGGSEFSDAEFKVFNDADNTKELTLDISGVTTSTTRTLSVADRDGEIATKADNVSIGFNTGLSNPSHSEGISFYDNTKKAFSYYNEESDVTVNVGQEVLIPVWNESGSPIANGKVVYPSGVNAASGLTTIELADASEKDKCRLIAMATHDIENNSRGYVTRLGSVGSLNTTGLSGVIYLSATSPGDFTTTRPDDGAYVTTVGAVAKVDAVDGVVVIDPAINDITVEVTDTNGFPTDQRTGTTLSFVNGTRTFTIAPTGSDFHYYQTGDKYEKTSGQSVVITDVEGGHVIYFDGDTLTSIANPNDGQISDIIRTKCLVSYMYWNATASEYVYLNDERHGISMSPATHTYLHFSRGSQYLSGLALNSILADDTGALDTHAQFGVDSGFYTDEDLLTSASAIGSTTGLPIYYLDGVNADLRKTTETGFSVLTDTTAGVGVTGRVVFNELTGGAWQLTTVVNNDFVLCHVFAINGIDTEDRQIAFIGQADYQTVSAARTGAEIEISNLLLQIPVPEIVPLATVIYQTSTGYANAVKSRIRTTDDGGDYVDWRTSELSPGAAPTSHNNLADLQLSNTGVTYGHIDDQAQTIYGTKVFNDNVGIGLTPTANMDGLSVEDGLLTIKETSTPTADSGYAKIYAKTTDNKLYFQDGTGAEFEIGGTPISSPWVPVSGGIEYASGFVRVVDDLLWSENDGNGGTAVTSMEGVLLSSNAMNATDRYTPALWFGSTDANLTTQNPKKLAGIIGYATQEYSADTDGGMGMEFYTMPNDPGASPTPELAMSIDNDQAVVMYGDFSFFKTGEAASIVMTVNSTSTTVLRKNTDQSVDMGAIDFGTGNINIYSGATRMLRLQPNLVHVNIDNASADFKVNGSSGPVINYSNALSRLTISSVIYNTGGITFQSGVQPYTIQNATDNQGIEIIGKYNTTGNGVILENQDPDGSRSRIGLEGDNLIRFYNGSSTTEIMRIDTTDITLNYSNDTVNLVVNKDTSGVAINYDATDDDLTIGCDTIFDTGVIALQETTTPTATTNYGKVYTKTDNKLYFQDGAGTEHELAFV